MLYDVIKKALVTEKSNQDRVLNKYTFEVKPSANKEEIKKAIEKIFSVKVLTVNTAKVRGKQRRYGKVTGATQAWKKAIVTLKEGQTIEALSA
jgi:large subunit ribosomal protein L23